MSEPRLDSETAAPWEFSEARDRRARRERGDSRSESGDASSESGRSAERERKPKEPAIDAGALHEAALSYLDRYDASTEQLRRVLLRRIRKVSDQTKREHALVALDELLVRFTGSRLVDDGRFARTFVDAARRRGSSSRKIEQKLRERGLDSTLVRASLEQSRDETGVDDYAAALTFARKKRLGTRHDLRDPKARAKALAALARQGFSFDAASAALATLQRGDAEE